MRISYSLMTFSLILFNRRTSKDERISLYCHTHDSFEHLGTYFGSGDSESILNFVSSPAIDSSGVVNWMCCMDFPRVYTDENVVARVMKGYHEIVAKNESRTLSSGDSSVT